MDNRRKFLFLGDSEVTTLMAIVPELQRRWNAAIRVQGYPGKDLTALGRHITHELKMGHGFDYIFLFGLTCHVWTKVNLFPDGQGPQVISNRPSANLSLLPAFLDATSRVVSKLSPGAVLYLVVPSAKDIYSFNVNYLTKKGLEHLIPDLDTHPLLNRSYLATKARAIQLDMESRLINPNIWWKNKHIISMNDVFDFHWRANKVPEPFPTSVYLNGQTDILEAWDLLYDGLHYTPDCFKAFWQFIIKKCGVQPIPTPTERPSTSTTKLSRVQKRILSPSEPIVTHSGNEGENVPPTPAELPPSVSSIASVAEPPIEVTPAAAPQVSSVIPRKDAKKKQTKRKSSPQPSSIKKRLHFIPGTAVPRRATPGNLKNKPGPSGKGPSKRVSQNKRKRTSQQKKRVKALKKGQTPVASGSGPSTSTGPDTNPTTPASIPIEFERDLRIFLAGIPRLAVLYRVSKEDAVKRVCEIMKEMSKIQW